jgi:hypothetical protein
MKDFVRFRIKPLLPFFGDDGAIYQPGSSFRHLQELPSHLDYIQGLLDAHNDTTAHEPRIYLQRSAELEVEFKEEDS